MARCETRCEIARRKKVLQKLGWVAGFYTVAAGGPPPTGEFVRNGCEFLSDEERGEKERTTTTTTGGGLLQLYAGRRAQICGSGF